MVEGVSSAYCRICPGIGRDLFPPAAGPAAFVPATARRGFRRCWCGMRRISEQDQQLSLSRLAPASRADPGGAGRINSVQSWSSPATAASTTCPYPPSRIARQRLGLQRRTLFVSAGHHAAGDDDCRPDPESPARQFITKQMSKATRALPSSSSGAMMLKIVRLCDDDGSARDRQRGEQQLRHDDHRHVSAHLSRTERAARRSPRPRLTLHFDKDELMSRPVRTGYDRHASDLRRDRCGDKRSTPGGDNPSGKNLDSGLTVDLQISASNRRQISEDRPARLRQLADDRASSRQARQQPFIPSARDGAALFATSSGQATPASRAVGFRVGMGGGNFCGASQQAASTP